MMRNMDVLKMCVRSLLKRKLRTFLTILGVLIGTASIVVMISLGLAVNVMFDKTLKNMSDITIITVYNYGMASADGNARQNSGGPPPLDDNAVAQFGRIPGVLGASALIQTAVYIKSGHSILPGITVYGINPKVMGIFYNVDKGRLLQDGDKYDMVFGAIAELQFMKENSRLGYSERLQNYQMGQVDQKPLVDLLNANLTASVSQNLLYPGADTASGVQLLKPFHSRCVGILKSAGYNTDVSVFMDFKTVRKLIADRERIDQAQSAYDNNGSARVQKAVPAPPSYDTVQVKCADLNNVKSVSKNIGDMGFYAEYPSQGLDSMQSMANSMQAMLGAIGAVSLLVAAIGIANTMVMSIYERTREIGVMKVIGAALSDIRKLFLLEAALIGLAGGVLGILASLFISYLLNNSSFSMFGVVTDFLGDGSANAVSLVTPWLCGAAALFATLIGLVSGYFPARRAMRISAVKALNNI